MTARVVFVLLICLAACTNQPPVAQPHLGLGLSIGAHGLRVVPRVTTRAGGVTLSAGAGIGV